MKLQAGFARIDITAPLGTYIPGYYYDRYADGILDPILATALAFDDGEKKAILMSVDLIGMNQDLQDQIHQKIAERIGMDYEGIFVHCTHSHTSPQARGEYFEWLLTRFADLAELAMQDLKPVTYMGYTRGTVEEVSFIRRYRMKDGTLKAKPKRLDPNILCQASEPDTVSQLLVIEREGGKEIGVVNFQVHPDVISGCKLSADYPKFVRDTYEGLVENSLCMYINGAQGDSNHVNVWLSPEVNTGYKWSRYMGVKIAASVAAKRELLEELPIGSIGYGQKNITVRMNKGRPEQMEDAKALHKIYKEQGRDVARTYDGKFETVSGYQEACRILSLVDLPDEKELHLTALKVGDWVVAGFPGEPFTEIGREVKAGSPFTLTMASCCANGYEGYYPSAECFEQGGYEVAVARFTQGTAEKLIENSLELVKSLK